MAVLMAFTLDSKAFVQAFAQLRSEAPKAIARGLNRTAQGAQTDAVRAVAENMKIRQAAVRKAIRIAKANSTLLQAEVVATGRRIPLIEFKARQTKRGVTYDLGGGRQRIPSGFITIVGAGHVGVFARKGKARLPIQEKFGPSIPKVFANQAIMDAIRTRAEADLEKNVAHEIEYLLSLQK